MESEAAADHPDTVARPDLDRGLTAAIAWRVRPWVEWFGAGRLSAAIVTVVVVVVGGWWLLRAPPPATEAGLPFAAASSPTTGPTTANGPPAGASSSPTSGAPEVVVVHVAGAVVQPGVYELAGGARVHGAIAAAGGVLPEADTAALNLAAAIADGERVYVPVLGEAVPPVVGGSVGAGSTAPPGPIDINDATAAELDELPGIGPSTAAAIVAHRAEHGPFATVDDLEAVRGIGPAKLDAVRDLVRV